MSGPLDDLQRFIEIARDRGAEIDVLKSMITRIDQCAADILAIMERAPAKQDQPPSDDAALIAALERLQIPAPVVTSAPVINVMPAPVQIMPAPPPAPVVAPAEARGFKLVVTSRDGNGNIATISLKPE